MKPYYKHLYVQQLNRQIQNGFDEVKQKLLKISRHRISNEQLEQKFDTYLQRVISKHKGNEKEFNRSSQIEALMTLRRKRLKQSLQKYETSNKKCKTAADFYSNKKRQQNSFGRTMVQFSQKEAHLQPQIQINQNKISIPLSFKGKAKTEVSTYSHYLSLARNSQQRRRLQRFQSITKDFGPRVEQHKKLFSFAKNQKKNEQAHCRTQISNQSAFKSVKNTYDYIQKDLINLPKKQIQNLSKKTYKQNTQPCISKSHFIDQKVFRHKAIKLVKQRMNRVTRKWKNRKNKQKETFSLYIHVQNQRKLRHQIKGLILTQHSKRWTKLKTVI